MSDKSELKAELERKKQRIAQIREEKKRKEEEKGGREARDTETGLKSSPSSTIMSEVKPNQLDHPLEAGGSMKIEPKSTLNTYLFNYIFQFCFYFII